MPRKVRDLISWAAVLAWAAVIFSMSALPGSAVPGKYGSLAHFAEYAILAGLLVISLPREHGRVAGAIVLAIAVASSYGVTDELHQAYVPLRVPDVLDWLTDTAGAITGATVAATAVAYLSRRSERRQ